jgi:hypothetical protein
MIGFHEHFAPKVASDLSMVTSKQSYIGSTTIECPHCLIP